MSEIKLTADSGGGTTSLKAPSSTTSNADVVLKLPVADGSANQVLKTDGSGQLSFTSNAGTTINNNADNRIITGSGTASTLNGESGLTYDSTTLVVSGSGEVKALSHTADNTDKKALFTTGHRDTSEENVSGVVVQGADGDNMVDIGGGQGSYNSATKIRFYTGANAATTTGTERMRINPDGNVGIGTSTPTASNAAYNAALLHIHQTNSSSAGSQVHLTTGASGQGIADGSIIAQWSDNNLYINNQESGNIQFYTGGASRARLDSDGLKFGTDTAAANALDDYEEGTHTPSMFTDSGSITLKSSADTLAYTKIGRVVHVTGRLDMNSVSSPSGDLGISLPFTVANNITDIGASVAPSVFIYNATGGATGEFVAWADGNVTAMYIRLGSNTYGTGAASLMQANTEIRVSATYFTHS